jgi:hypothetical protein
MADRRPPGDLNEPFRTRRLRSRGIGDLFSVFVVFSRDTEASGFAVYLPFVYLLGALIIAVPVYLSNRARLTQPAGAPPG